MRKIVLKRVPIGFDWPIGDIWFGFQISSIPCEVCDGRGLVNWGQNSACPVCNASGEIKFRIEPPQGEGYQIWETHEYMVAKKGEEKYYPLSSVFPTAEDLADWLSRNFTIENNLENSKDTWLEAIKEETVDVTYGLYQDMIKPSNRVKEVRLIH
ncbi:MAG: hypothetical protein ACOC44_05750 [Promethearchaeia archaeon]